MTSTNEFQMSDPVSISMRKNDDTLERLQHDDRGMQIPLTPLSVIGMTVPSVSVISFRVLMVVTLTIDFEHNFPCFSRPVDNIHFHKHVSSYHSRGYRDKN